MKKLIRLSVIIQFISICSFAQSLTDERRLIKKTWILPNGESSMSEYSYDGLGRINRIKQYENKKFHSTQSAFVYNSQNLITSYNESFADGADTIQQLFSYDIQNRLISIIEVEFKNSGKRTTLTRTFSYTSDEIRESQVRLSFGGKLIDAIKYTLDEKGNMVRKTSIQNGKKAADFIYGDYESKPNPLIFTGAYFYTELSSKQNGKEGYWEGGTPSKTNFTYSPNGLLQNAAITYILDNRAYTHQYIYTYAKIKYPVKVVVK